MSIEELKALCDQLEVQRKQLAKLQEMLGACKLSGHQHEITLHVSGVGSLPMSYLDRSTGYASRIIRGREIALLGVKKAVAAMVDAQASIVHALEQEIANARVSP